MRNPLPSVQGGFIVKDTDWWSNASGRCEPDNSEYLILGAFQLLRSISGKILTPVEGRGWANISGILRDALKGKGNYGLGSGTYDEAMQAGKSWVGYGFTISSNGSACVSLPDIRPIKIR